MVTIRRIYLYLVCLASLGMLITGVVNLGATVIESVLGSAGWDRGARDMLAWSGALSLVGLPIWAAHWTLSTRSARHDPAERAALLRRLYLYVTCTVLLILAAASWEQLAATALRALLQPGSLDATLVARLLWQATVFTLFWRFHTTTTLGDRRAVGESGGSATLRRWYSYSIQIIALLLFLAGTRDLLQWIGFLITEPGAIDTGNAVGNNIARAAVWLGAWHITTTSREAHDTLADDRHATLRAVQGFLVVATTLAFCLGESARTLFYVLARLLGVAAPGGVGGSVIVAVVNPLSTIVVYGAALIMIQQRLRRDSADAEAARQAGVRRLYTHLVALFSLSLAATGLAGVLWRLWDATAGPEIFASNQTLDPWREAIALFVSLVSVGFPTWLLHWRPSPPAEERQSLSRRLYLFAVLLAAVLTLLGSGATLVQRLLSALLAPQGSLALDVGHALSVMIVAGLVALYHWRVLRQDMRERHSVQTQVADSGLPKILVEIEGATSEEITRTLERLPHGAHYTIQLEPVSVVSPEP